MMFEKYDRILLEGMLFHGYVGVNDFEKKDGQPFQVDLQLFCDELQACETDRLEQTIDYGKIFDLVASTVEQAHFDLIERLAGKIAENVLSAFTLVKAAEVTVRKPKAPIKGNFSAMGVQIFRERKD
jgi:dihydroneopterin aldolase